MMKQADTQQERTRKKGEVFSPAWVCNKMNNALDADWFGPDAPKNLFTEELSQSWQTTSEPVPFDNSHKWEKYVDSRRLEVTCGEAPFLASRYDAATGELIPVQAHRHLRPQAANSRGEHLHGSRLVQMGHPCHVIHLRL